MFQGGGKCKSIQGYLTEQPDARQISGLTFATISKEDKAKTRASWGAMELVASIVVLPASSLPAFTSGDSRSLMGFEGAG